jgi:hypothetical protein
MIMVDTDEPLAKIEAGIVALGTALSISASTWLNDQVWKNRLKILLSDTLSPIFPGTP